VERAASAFPGSHCRGGEKDAITRSMIVCWDRLLWSIPGD
jgi:hypothetical protein